MHVCFPFCSLSVFVSLSVCVCGCVYAVIVNAKLNIIEDCRCHMERSDHIYSNIWVIRGIVIMRWKLSHLVYLYIWLWLLSIDAKFVASRSCKLIRKVRMLFVWMRFCNRIKISLPLSFFAAHISHSRSKICKLHMHVDRLLIACREWWCLWFFHFNAPSSDNFSTKLLPSPKRKLEWNWHHQQNIYS